MSSFKVAVTDYGFPDLQPERDVLEPLGFEFVTGQCKSADEAAILCRHADAILTQWAPITGEVIHGLEQCRIIVRYGIGVDNVDLEAARDKNIPVVNVPDYAVQEVADHTLSLLLSLVRKIPRIVSQVRDGIWEIAPCRPIRGLSGMVLGLAGFGNISREVANRARAFGMEIAAFDPFVNRETFDRLGVRQVNWEELLHTCDILSVHLPLTKDTKHLLNKEAFRAMKESSFVINTSRGGIIRTADLIEALLSNRIAGAAIDVLEEEPIAKDSPLLRMDQCLVTSHCAWYSETSLSRLQLYAAKEIARLFKGETPKHIVNGVHV